MEFEDQFTDVELAVAESLEITPELVKTVLDEFEFQFDAIERARYQNMKGNNSGV